MYTEYLLVRDDGALVIRETKYVDGATVSVSEYPAKLERKFRRQYGGEGRRFLVHEYSCWINGEKKLFRQVEPYLNYRLIPYKPKAESTFRQIELE